MKHEKPKISIDFDGVIHSFTTPWTVPWVIHDGPVPGAFEWLFSVLQKYDVVILSARAKSWWGQRAIYRWLREHAPAAYWKSYRGSNGKFIKGFETIVVTNKKPVALVYIDDRGFRFTGKFPSVYQLSRQVPWHGNVKKGVT